MTHFYIGLGQFGSARRHKSDACLFGSVGVLSSLTQKKLDSQIKKIDS
jgi:hypothetical protein